jgi:hypothetical protein
MLKKETYEIGEELVVRNRGEITENRLEFDPETGELVVRRNDVPMNPDATTVDQIATDGFA